MDKGLIIEFDYMYKDMVLSHVIYNISTEDVKVENFTDDMDYSPFGYKTEGLNYNDLDDFYRSRCFDEERVDCRELLDGLGCEHFFAYEIVRKTHGILIGDHRWVRFKDEGNMTYKEAKDSIGIPW